MTLEIVILLAYAVASRLAYVGWVGHALQQQDAHQTLTRVAGIEAGYQHFRQRAAVLMRNDAFSIVLVSVMTRSTLDLPIPRVVTFIVAGLLMIVGLGSKVWAARTLGDDAYYWRNFFDLQEHAAPNPPGPYRYMDNPMYTVGYLHAYGFALALGSTAGLGIALFDQVAILVFHFLVEKPHYDRLTIGGSR